MQDLDAGKQLESAESNRGSMVYPCLVFPVGFGIILVLLQPSDKGLRAWTYFSQTPSILRCLPESLSSRRVEYNEIVRFFSIGNESD